MAYVAFSPVTQRIHEQEQEQDEEENRNLAREGIARPRTPQFCYFVGRRRLPERWLAIKLRRPLQCVAVSLLAAALLAAAASVAPPRRRAPATWGSASTVTEAVEEQEQEGPLADAAAGGARGAGARWNPDADDDADAEGENETEAATGTTTTATTTTTTVGGPCSLVWGQCAGDGYMGPPCCEPGTTCLPSPLSVALSYRQCLPTATATTSVTTRTTTTSTATTRTATSRISTTSRQDNSSSAANVSAGAATTQEVDCVALWAQCGGEGYSGSTCCENGSACEDSPLGDFPSYRQCRPKTSTTTTTTTIPPPCEDPAEGTQCYQTVMWTIQTGVWVQPGAYHGLTSTDDFKDFQEWHHLFNRNNSGCQQACRNGTCKFIFEVRGCDTLNTWTCQEDDGSLVYDCCCRKFHRQKNLTKPENATAALVHAIQAVESDAGPQLFCTALCMPGTYEVELLRVQYEGGGTGGMLGLFGCELWEVFSNTTVRLSPEGEEPVVNTKLVNGSLSGILGGKFHTVLNTAVFLKFWEQVIEDPKSWQADWIVKLDPDTMFMPVRLKALLATQHGPLARQEPEKGIYLNNCHVGMHGPIEVLSTKALATYREGRHECVGGPPARHGQEDWYLRACFKELGILKVDAFNLLFEATWACQERPSTWQPYAPPCFSPQVAFHPFKTVRGWMRCHLEAANHPWQLPTAPIRDPPGELNENHG